MKTPALGWVLALLLPLLGCYNMGKSMNDTPESMDILFRAIQGAVKDYVDSNPTMSEPLRRKLLTALSASAAGPHDDGFVIGDWTFSRSKSTMTADGHWIGKEHVWYEGDLDISGDVVKLRTVKTKREYIR